MLSKILLKGGTLLIHDGDDHVISTKADLLISGSIISKIAPEIPFSGAEEVINCTDKVISPGFIDCHQHVSFIEDFKTGSPQFPGSLQSSNYTLSDFYWGQLTGCLTLLNAGTTTVLDHAHLKTSPEVAPIAISATLTSGIRSIFAFALINKVSTWNTELTFSSSGLLAPWVLSTFNSLASRSPFGPTGRVALGLAFDGWYLPRETCLPLLRDARSHNFNLLTTHFGRNAMGDTFSFPAMAKEWDLLGDGPDSFPNVVFSHACGATEEDLCVMRETKNHFASTSGTELQMALGRSICFDEEAFEIACVGGDCHSAGGPSVVGELRLGLQAARGERNQRFIENGAVPRRTWRTVEDAFNLGIVKGARALGLEERVGRLREGIEADVVVWEGRSPGMVCAVQENPVAAVVLHSSPQDVDLVIVDGVMRKRGKRLIQ